MLHLGRSWHRRAVRALGIVLSVVIVIESSPLMAAADLRAPWRKLVGTGDTVLAQTVPTPLPAPAIPVAPAVVPVIDPGPRNSLRLDGESGYVEAAHHPELNVTADWTIEAWFRDQDPAGFNHPRARILAKWDPDDREVPFFIGIENDGLFVGIRERSAPYVLRYDLRQNRVVPGIWHHVAATLRRSNRELKLYVDGVAVAATTLPGVSVGNTAPLRIGVSEPKRGDFLQGLIDDVRVWKVVRTADEIAANFMTELVCPPPGLVGNWKFNEGVGPIAADSSDIREDGHLIGGAGWSVEQVGGTPPCVTTPVTATQTKTPTATTTASPTKGTPPPSLTPTRTSTPSLTPTRTSTPAATATRTPSNTPTATEMPTQTPVPTPSPTDMPTDTPTPTASATETPTPTRSPPRR